MKTETFITMIWKSLEEHYRSKMGIDFSYTDMHLDIRLENMALDHNYTRYLTGNHINLLFDDLCPDIMGKLGLFKPAVKGFLYHDEVATIFDEEVRNFVLENTRVDRVLLPHLNVFAWIYHTITNLPENDESN